MGKRVPRRGYPHPPTAKRSRWGARTLRAIEGCVVPSQFSVDTIACFFFFLFSVGVTASVVRLHRASQSLGC